MPVFRLVGNHRYRISHAQRTRNLRHKKWWLQSFPRFISRHHTRVRFRGAPFHILEEHRWGEGFWHK